MTSAKRDRLTRRDWFKISATGVAGLSTTGWFESLAAHGAQAAAEGKKHKSCIVLYMAGGPGQMFTFHPTPRFFPPIPTGVPGIQLCDSLPKLAQQMKHMAILCSMSTGQLAHAPAVIEMHTGFRATAGIPYPSMGSIVAKELGDPEFPLPNYVVCGTQTVSWGSGPGHLGAQYMPMNMNEAAKGLEALNVLRSAEAKVEKHVNLVKGLDDSFLSRYQGGTIAAHSKGYEGVLRLLRSPKAAAFDLDKEPAASRARYGKGEFAERCLLARRLVEVGVPFVEISMPGWDTHSGPYDRHKALTAELDNPMATLIADLQERGLLDSTLVVWMGEFGRTPGDGGGHYPAAWTTVLAGGGLKTGQKIGKTDEKGATVKDRPISAAVFMATILKALGIRHNKKYHVGGQPVPIVEAGAEPLHELFS
jgi:hypothetical protein